MGGGSKVQQTNTGQAGQSFTGATGTANTAQKLGNQYSAQQQQLYNTLWGSPTSGGGTSGGAVGSFLDPSKLNVSSPTGPYALQFTKQKEQLAKQYQDAQGATNRTLAQSGFGPGTPSGFGASLAAENARGLANATGDAYTAATTNSYQDALNNFWKAAGMAQSGAGTAQQGALTGTGTAANVYNNLYGTAGHGNVTQNSNLAGNLIGAGGQVGAAAMCVAIGTLIRLDDGKWERVEQLCEGNYVQGLGRPNRVLRIERSVADCVKLVTDRGQSLTCSESHTLADKDGGYVKAEEAVDHVLHTVDGLASVEVAKPVGSMDVFRIVLDGTHSYLSDGIWSLE